MKALHALFLSGVVLSMGAITVGCGGDDDLGNPKADGGGDVVTVGDGGPPGDGSTTDANDGGGPQEFTDFVKGLIVTQTSNTTLPTKTEDKTFVDSHNPAAFPPSFFP